MKKRFLLSTILLIVTLGLIVSCNNEVALGPGYGSITVFTGDSSKSVQPAAEDIAFSYYIIHCTCFTPEINPIERRFEGSSVKIENMVEGQWTLYVEGFNSSDELIGKSGNMIVTIVRDSTTNLNFFLEPIEGVGTLSLSIQVQTSKVSTIDCSLKLGETTYRTTTMTSENRTLNNDGSYTFTKTLSDVANGLYTSTVTMKDSEENLIGIALTPAIHIYADLESAYEFSWKNLKNLLPSVDVPIPSVNPGRCYYNTEVSFSTIEEGTTIWYSLNGDDYEKYTEPLHITDDSRLRLYSTKPNLVQSEIVEYTYVCRVTTPVISLDSGNHTLAELTDVTISENDQNATVYYTLDGSDPSVSNTRIQYQTNASLSFNTDTNLKIVAIEGGFLNSEILNISYVVAAPTPEPSLLSGTFTGDQELSFIASKGAKVYYTIDGSIPDENSILYTEPISITNSCTIKAIMVIDGLVPSNVLALDYNFNCLFTITDSGTISPKNKNSLPSDVVIPKRIDGITVTSIGNSAFSDCAGLTSIEIPNSVTSIGFGAFSNCTGLKSIEISNSVISIGYSAFSGWTSSQTITINYGGFGEWWGDGSWNNCNATIEVSIPDTTALIEKYAFYNCTGLTSIVIPNSVTSIGNKAFFGCTGLTSIVISNSVTSIGNYAFSGCTSLTSIKIPNSVTSIGSCAFNNCTGLTSMEITSSVATFGRSTNSCGVFTGYFGSVVFAEGTTVIPAYAFYGADVTGVTIPSTVTSIGDYAFLGCTGLASIDIPSSVTSIGENAFSGYTSLTSIEIPNSVTSIGERAFYGCTGLTSIEIPSSVTSIGNYAFLGCTSLTSIEIPNSVTSIGSCAFNNCTGLTSMEIPSSVATFGRSTNSCGVFTGYFGSVVFAEGTTVIPAYAFYGADVTGVTIPSTVTSIGERAFSGCTGLTSIEIPNSVTSIGKGAFSGCTGLTNIEIPSSVVTFGNSYSFGVFTGYFGSVVFAEGTTVIPTYAFYWADVTGVTIPSTVTNIGSAAFSGCTGLTSIEIPNSVTNIGSSAFSGCTGLTSIEIPNSVTSIGSYAFDNCTGLTSIVIPNSVTSIGKGAFSGCTGLTNIEIPSSVVTFGNSYSFGVFTGYFGSVAFAEGTTVIPAYAFYGADVTGVTIPSTVTSIGERAFSGCTGLTSIEIPNSVTNIGSSAFSGCTGLTKMVYKGTQESWNTIQGISDLPQSVRDAVFFEDGESDTTIQVLDPVKFTLSIVSATDLTGDSLSGNIEFNAMLSPIVTGTSYTWYLDGNLVSSSPSYVLTNTNVSFGYHYLEVVVLLDGKPYSESLIFNYVN